MSGEQQYPYGEILASSEWLSLHLDDPAVKILDTRSQQAYAGGHVPGAVSAAKDFKAPGSQEPIAAEDFAHLAGALGVRPTDTVVCYDAEAPRAAHVWWAFWQYGHRDVRFLNGGLAQWIASGYPISPDTSEPKPVIYQLGDPREGTACSLEQAVTALGRPGVQFWDTRSEGEYTGQDGGRFTPPARLGHIPGAVHLEWSDLTDRVTGLFKPAEEMRRILDTKGIHPESEILTY